MSHVTLHAFQEVTRFRIELQSRQRLAMFDIQNMAGCAYMHATLIQEAGILHFSPPSEMPALFLRKRREAAARR